MDVARSFGRFGIRGARSRSRLPGCRAGTRRRLFLERLEDRVVLSQAGPLPALGDAAAYYLADGQRIGLDIDKSAIALKINRADSDARLSEMTRALELPAGLEIAAALTDSIFMVGGGGVSLPEFQREDVAWATTAFTSQASGNQLFVLDEAIVALVPGSSPGDIFDCDARVTGYRSLLGTPDQYVVTLGAAGQATLDYANKVRADPRVAWAVPNFYQQVERMFVPDDPLFSTQWHLHNTGTQVPEAVAGADVSAVAAWDIGTGTGVTIAVVDDGIERTHPDLWENIFVNPGEVAGNGIDDDGNGWIDDVSGWSFAANSPNPSVTADDRHGTSVAGVAAGRGNNGLGVTGAAFNARILPVQIFQGDSYVSDAATAQAIYYAAGRTANGLGTWNAAQVINCSWGGGSPSPAVTTALTWASNSARAGRGVATFISAGNGYGPVSYPASLSSSLAGVMAVGASNQRDLRAEYSNYGPELDFVAPSSDIDSPYVVGITTTDRTGSAGYHDGDYTDNTVAHGFGGTSSASPLAAGIGSLLLSVDPTLTAAQVKQLLRSTADKVGHLEYDSNGFNVEYGYGRLNALAALQQLGMNVVNTVPANRGTVGTPPQLGGGYRIDFSDPFSQLPADITASGVKVNGIPASGYAIVDADTLEFVFSVQPVTSEGLQTLTLDAGTVKRASDGDLVGAYAGSFRYDALPLAATGTTPAAGSTIQLPCTTLDIDFNEAVQASSVQASDFAVSLGRVVAAGLLDADTVRLTLADVDREELLTLSIPAGALTDTWGNPGTAYSASYVLDIDVVPFPGRWHSVAPLGSLVHTASVAASIGQEGDEDIFTLRVAPGQTIALAVTPEVGSTLQPHVSLVAPSGATVSAAAAVPGAPATVQAVPSESGTGLYQVIVAGVGGTTVGSYVVQVTLNAALEQESNDTLSSAQDLASSFISLGGTTGSRGTVLGSGSVTSKGFDAGGPGSRDDVFFPSADLDCYVLELAHNETVTVALTGLSKPASSFQLRDAAGVTLATSSAGSTNVDQVIADFTATAAGTNPYYVVVATTGDYSLVVTKNLSFDREPNNTAATAQPLSGALSVLGYLGPDYKAFTTDFEMGNWGSVPWVTTGDADWYVTTEDAVSGKYSARAGQIRDNQASTLSVTLTTGSGDVSFARRVSSEPYYDYLDFFIDGTLVDFWSGDVPFTTVSFPVEAGTHTFSWTYWKDYSISTGLDTALLDDVVFPPPIQQEDWYAVTFLGTQTALRLETHTPGDDSEEPANVLDMQIELYDSTGSTLLATSVPRPDGRNDWLLASGLVPGATYTIKVAQEEESTGAYILTATESDALCVTRTLPAVGSTITLPFTTLDVQFGNAVQASSVQVSDFEVNQGRVVDAVLIAPDTVRLTLSGVDVEGTLTLTTQTGVITDTLDRPSAAFYGSYALDIGTVPLPARWQAVDPAGSLVHETSVSASIASGDDTDSFTFTAVPDQTITVAIRPVLGSGLRPQVTLVAPSGASVWAAADSAGAAAVLQSVPAEPGAGVYQVVVAGAEGGSAGGYTARVILNAALETEPNNTAAKAQNLDASLIRLGESASRGAVLGAGATLNDGFETGNLLHLPWVTSGDAAWFVTTEDAASGSFSVRAGHLDNWEVSTLAVALTTGAGTVSFARRVSSESGWDYLDFYIDNQLLGSWSGDVPFSTVSFPVTAGAHTFQWDYRKDVMMSGGLDTAFIDDVEFPLADTDYYAIQLAQGETVTLALEGLAGIARGVELRDAAGHTLAHSVAGPANVDQLLAHFTAPTAGTNTYHVVVDANTKYHLVVTKNLDFETESNSTPDTAQPLGDAARVLGSLGPEVTSFTEGFETGDLSGLPWVSAGAAAWFVTAEDAASGTYSARAGDIADGQVSTLSVTLATQAGDIRFARRVASEAHYDHLEFYIDGMLMDAWSGDLPFALVSYPITPGMHTFDWSYRKDYIVSDGLDTAFIDDIAFPQLAETEPEDWYRIALRESHAVLQVETHTPADGPGGWLDPFDARIELYDAAGTTRIAAGTTLPDGRNERLVAEDLTPGATYLIRVTGEAGTSGAYVLAVQSSAPQVAAEIVSRMVFYNGSAYDGRNAAANAQDDAAIAIDKRALRPGQKATFSNYTSYDKGINGLMIDVRHLPAAPTVDDFLFRIGNDNHPYGTALTDPADDWTWAPAPVAIAVRPGAGQDGTDRVTLIWANGAIRKCWLQVTVLATDATGLVENDVFYVGNAIGEAGNSTRDAVVNATDEIAARNNPHGPFNPATLDDRYDYNRDRLVNAADQIIARNNRTSPFTSLLLIAPPMEPVGMAGAGGAGAQNGAGEGSSDLWADWPESLLPVELLARTGRRPVATTTATASIMATVAQAGWRPRSTPAQEMERPVVEDLAPAAPPLMGQPAGMGHPVRAVRAYDRDAAAAGLPAHRLLDAVLDELLDSWALR